MKKVFQETLPVLSGNLEAQLKQNATDWFVGKKVRKSNRRIDGRTDRWTALGRFQGRFEIEIVGVPDRHIP